jgi:hypothetical protein
MQSCGECKAKGVPLHGMDEVRKRVLLIAASILAARKLAQYDSGARVPATVSAIADAIRLGRGDFEGTGQALAGERMTLDVCRGFGTFALSIVLYLLWQVV